MLHGTIVVTTGSRLTCRQILNATAREAIGSRELNSHTGCPPFGVGGCCRTSLFDSISHVNRWKCDKLETGYAVARRILRQRSRQP